MKHVLRRATYMLETITLLVVIAFALLLMKTYLQRSLMGKYKGLADEIGTQYDPQASFINSAETTRTVTGEYMLYDDMDGDGEAEYVGTAVIASVDVDVNSTEGTGFLSASEIDDIVIPINAYNYALCGNPTCL